MFTYDPHPHGCPFALRLAPIEMSGAVKELATKLQDLVEASIFVINPSKGQSYPILAFHEELVDNKPRMVVFPGWEDVRGTKRRRRVDFKRQSTLLQRLADAGVKGESFEERYDEAEEISEDDAPLVLPVAVPQAGFDSLIYELNDYLGDMMRITVTEVAVRGERFNLVRLYALIDEGSARVVLYPGWMGDTESDSHEFNMTTRSVERAVQAEGVRELPVEVWIA